MRRATTAEEPLTWVDGRLVPPADAIVSAYDRGFRAGEGVFETMRSYAGHPFRLTEHVARAATGATVLGFDIGSQVAIAGAVRATAAANLTILAGADGVLRLTISPGRIEPGTVVPIVAVDGSPIGSGRPGPVTATVHKAFQEEVAREVGATSASAG